MRTSFRATTIVLGAALAVGAAGARTAQAKCQDLPSHSELQAALDAAVDAVRSAGLSLLGLVRRQRTLEEAFLEIVGEDEQ